MKTYKLLTLAFSVVLVLTFPRPGIAGQNESCSKVGQLQVMDLASHVFMLKSDGGDLTNVRFENSTQFLQVPAGKQASPASLRLDPIQVNAGDRVCIPSSDDKEPIKQALVTRRTDIEAQQRDELVRWQAKSAFGVITALDPRTRNITLKLSHPTTSSQITIDASGPVTYQAFSAGRFRELPTLWNQLSVGNYLYVRGEKSGDAHVMAARLIVAGDFRTFTGTIESMDALGERIRVRAMLSGDTRTVDADPAVLYVTSPAGPMRRIDFGDIQPGDPVLVLAQRNGQAGDVQAVAVIRSFSSFGFGDREDGRLPWSLENGK